MKEYFVFRNILGDWSLRNVGADTGELGNRRFLSKI